MKKNLYLICITLAAIVCIVAGSFRHLAGFSSGRGSAGTYSSELLFEEDEDRITELDISSEVMDVTLCTGDSFRISYRGSGRLKPQITAEAGSLSVTQTGAAHGRTWLNWQNNFAGLIIQIPDDRTLGHIRVTANVGDLDLDGLTLSACTMRANVGDLSIRNAALGISDFSLDTGDLTIENCSFETLNASNNVGDIEIETSEPLHDCAIELSTDVGEVEVNDTDRGRTFAQSGTAGKLTVKNHIGDVELMYPPTPPSAENTVNMLP